jgi:hypothetical protein
VTVELRDGWLFGSLPDDTGREWPIVLHPQPSARGPLKAVAPNLVLHTTETDGYVKTLRYPSQWQCGAGIIGQHIKLGLAGDAVNDWDLHAQQIEMVGRSKLAKWLPAEPTLGPTVALVGWLHRTGRIKTGIRRPADWPVVLDRGPQAVTGYYRRNAGLWPDTPGVYGHVDIPANSHWDPGSFDYPTFFARVRNLLEGDDDVSFAEYEDGWKAHRAGTPLNAAWPPAKRFGWTARREATTTPKAVPGPAGPPGPPGPKGDTATLPPGSKLVVET